MKQKLVTDEHITDLQNWWNQTGKIEHQRVVNTTVAKDGKLHSSRNGYTHTGWTVGGSAGYTRLVKAAHLPYDRYWTGSAPTPSTQYPSVIYHYLLAKYPEYK